MSRAFITDKEDWVYCPKAGERCMHAEAGKECGKTDCEHFKKTVKMPTGSTTAVKVVKRKPKAEAPKAGSATKAPKAETTKAAGKAQPQRKTKKSTLKKPKLWGGRPLD